MWIRSSGKVLVHGGLLAQPLVLGYCTYAECACKLRRVTFMRNTRCAETSEPSNCDQDEKEFIKLCNET